MGAERSWECSGSPVAVARIGTKWHVVRAVAFVGEIPVLAETTHSYDLLGDALASAERAADRGPAS